MPILLTSATGYAEVKAGASAELPLLDVGEPTEETTLEEEQLTTTTTTTTTTTQEATMVAVVAGVEVEKEVVVVEVEGT